VQLIDLDAARGAATTRRSSRDLPAPACRVGGGIPQHRAARDVLASGAHAVIASSALFRDGAVDVAFARRWPTPWAPTASSPRWTAGRPGRHPRWKTALPITAVEAVSALSPTARIPLHARRQGRPDAGHRHGRDHGGAPRHVRRVTAAGGITTWDEIDRLDARGIDAVVGMAIYTALPN
jgi:hypothetical protein